MKRFNLKTLFTLAMLLIVPVAHAYDFMVDSLAYDINPDGTTVTLTYLQPPTRASKAYTNLSDAVTIPDNVINNGISYPVTAIGNAAFYDCSGLTSVTIPNSVTAIGSGAFYECTGLTSITIPNSVTTIGSNAFNGCTSLTSITIPNSVIHIGDFAFANTTWFNSQPDGLIYAGLVAYRYKGTMPSSTSIIIRDGTHEICSYAFAGHSGLISVSIPNSVTYIGDGAFGNCSGLTSITIPNSVTSIGYNVFGGCGLTSITIPNSVTSIGDYAFSYCSRLTSVFIPNSVTSIGNYAFSYCSGLTSVFIPNSVTSIGDYAFRDGSGLTSVTIPNSVTTIGNYAFFRCSGLTRIDAYPNPEKVGMGSNVFYSEPYRVPINCSLHVLPKYLSAYLTANQWRDFFKIEADLIEIGDINADEEISIADVTLLVDVVLRQKSTSASDVNGDGETSVADITALTDLLLSRQ